MTILVAAITRSDFQYLRELKALSLSDLKGLLFQPESEDVRRLGMYRGGLPHSLTIDTE